MRVPLRGGGTEGVADSVEIKPVPSPRTEVLADRPELLAPVLASIVGALAARRDLSVDRMSDAVLVTDAIAAAAPSRFTDGRVRLGLEDVEAGIQLRVGPMEAGAAEQIREDLRLPEMDGSIEALIDELVVEGDGDGEYLLISFAAAAPAP
jgi:hypothetical protein